MKHTGKNTLAIATPAKQEIEDSPYTLALPINI